MTYSALIFEESGAMKVKSYGKWEARKLLTLSKNRAEFELRKLYHEMPMISFFITAGGSYGDWTTERTLRGRDVGILVGCIRTSLWLSHLRMNSWVRESKELR